MFNQFEGLELIEDWESEIHFATYFRCCKSWSENNLQRWIILQLKSQETSKSTLVIVAKKKH